MDGHHFRVWLAFAVGMSTGCVAEIGSEADQTGAARNALRRCHPTGNPYNCEPPNHCRDFRRVCEPRRNWPIHRDTELFDGLGGLKGIVADPTVRVNYGIRKELGGRILVYVWAVRVREGGRRSGWVEQADVVHASELEAAMGSSRHRDPGDGDYPTLRTVTGGDTERYDDLKIQPNESRGGRNATDYLLRPGRVVNMLYSVPGRGIGGHSVDSFPVGVTFHRARGVSQIVVPLYPPGSSRSVDALHFVYGWVHDGRQPRYGWIAEEAMVHAGTGTDPGGAGDECWVRCQDGSLHRSVQPSAEACRGWYEVCADRGRVARMKYGDEYIYDASW